MEDFRLRQKVKGLAQIWLRVSEEDADFFKHLSKYSRPEKELIQKERYGHAATSQAYTKQLKEKIVEMLWLATIITLAYVDYGDGLEQIKVIFMRKSIILSKFS